MWTGKSRNRKETIATKTIITNLRQQSSTCRFLKTKLKVLYLQDLISCETISVSSSLTTVQWVLYKSCEFQQLLPPHASLTYTGSGTLLNQNVVEVNKKCGTMSRRLHDLYMFNSLNHYQNWDCSLRFVHEETMCTRPQPKTSRHAMWASSYPYDMWQIVASSFS